MTNKHVVVLLVAVGCGASTGTSPVDANDIDAPSIDASSSACQSAVAASPGTVITASGPVTGSLDGSVYAWKGIPYAAPPIGALRWQPPAPATCWSQPLATTAFGPDCPQLGSDGSVEGDENCLALNVWAPTAAAGAPVMVFIHGGGNTQGAASKAVYDGAALATNTGAVVVTLDYRLGALGFLANAGLDAEQPLHVSGNYGILDQIAALRWVKANIAGFGGSPDRVLLFGESAGAQDTLVHVASPLSAGLFGAAIVESGGSYKNTLAQNETAMQPVIDAVGCTSAASIPACMRAVPAATLAAIPSAIGPLDAGMRYEPSIDGYVLTDTVPNVLAQGGQNKVPLVLGTNGDETSQMVPHVTSATDYATEVQTLYGATAAASLLALYPATSYTTPQQALVALTTDVTWTCPIRRLARSASGSQTPPVYRYHFTWSAPGLAGQVIGATHGIELPFVFQTFAADSYTPTASDLALSASVEGYWSRLAGTGDPDGGSAVAWPAYDASTDPYLQLDATIAAGAGLATANCDAIDALEASGS